MTWPRLFRSCLLVLVLLLVPSGVRACKANDLLQSQPDAFFIWARGLVWSCSISDAAERVSQLDQHGTGRGNGLSRLHR